MTGGSSTFTGTVIVAVAICSLVLMALGTAVYVRRNRFLQQGGLSAVIRRHYAPGGAGADRLRDLYLTLLCYEDRYPAFGAILSTIAPRFPLSYFSDHPEFVQALDTLVELSTQKNESPLHHIREHAALAAMVRLIIDNVQIQEIYGRGLEPLVDELIAQIQLPPDGDKS